MQTLTVALGDRSYPIHIGRGLLSRPELIAARLPQPSVAIVTNATVAPLYLAALGRALVGQGVRVVSIVLPDGEAYKTWETLNIVFDALIENRCERNTTLLSLGGGVIGDLGGFAAAVYQRGIPFIQIPTTLLAQVDSSVGGKTAINHPTAKNMIGAFYQPRAVIADIDTLSTLPDRELSAGIAEIVKYGLIRDAAFFAWLEKNMERLLAREAEALAHAIECSCQNKAEIVSLDEREDGLRALLNYGHTFGHAIEAGLGFGVWLHGEAIACGMVIAAQLSQRVGLITREDVRRVIEVLTRARLPVTAPDMGIDRYLELMGHDKKVQSGRIRFVLLRRIGEAFVTDEIPSDALEETLGRLSVHV